MVSPRSAYGCYECGKCSESFAQYQDAKKHFALIHLPDLKAAAAAAAASLAEAEVLVGRTPAPAPAVEGEETTGKQDFKGGKGHKKAKDGSFNADPAAVVIKKSPKTEKESPKIKGKESEEEETSSYEDTKVLGVLLRKRGNGVESAVSAEDKKDSNGKSKECGFCGSLFTRAFCRRRHEVICARKDETVKGAGKKTAKDKAKSAAAALATTPSTKDNKRSVKGTLPEQEQTPTNRKLLPKKKSATVGGEIKRGRGRPTKAEAAEVERRKSLGNAPVLKVKLAFRRSTKDNKNSTVDTESEFEEEVPAEVHAERKDKRKDSKRSGSGAPPERRRSKRAKNVALETSPEVILIICT